MRKQLFDIAVCDDVQTDREETAQLTEEICKAEGIVPVSKHRLKQVRQAFVDYMKM